MAPFPDAISKKAKEPVREEAMPILIVPVGQKSWPATGAVVAVESDPGEMEMLAPGLPGEGVGVVPAGLQLASVKAATATAITATVMGRERS
jgi:hypothetical protein